MSCVLFLHGLVHGRATEHDGRYLVRYDPFVPANGWRITLETSAEIEQAIRFPTMRDALECYRMSIGIRPDGKPDCPLTAYTVEIYQVEEP